MSIFSKGVKALGGILGGGKSSTYNAPDVGYLADTSKLDFLRDYKPEGYLSGDAETLFQDYLTSITGPEAFGAETDYLNQLLSDIDTSTGQAVGSAKLDYLDRGLGGVGQMSDIEAIGLAQTRGEGERQKNIARTELARSREEALRGAYGTRYEAGVSADESSRSASNAMKQLYAQLINQRDLGRAGIQSNIASAQAANTTKDAGLFSDMLRGFGKSFSQSLGSKLGGG